MEAKVEIITRFTPLSLSEKLSILDALSELVRQEMEASSTEVYKEIKREDCYIGTAAQRQEEVPLLHPFTGSINWRENSEMKSCPDCNNTNLIKWGKYRGQQRYKCKSCGHIHTSNSFTLNYGIRKIAEFESFGHRMFEGNYESLSVLSQDLKINRNTAFNWRHKYLSAIRATPSENQYSGTVEMDDVWFGLDEKGRETSDKVRPPIGVGDNDMQVKLLCCYERESNEFNAFVVRSGRLTQDDIERTVGNKFMQGSKIYSDKHQSIKAFTEKHSIAHLTFSAEKHAKDKVIHVQNINNYASEMNGVFLRKMKGVATKYLQNYANWFIVNKTIKKTDTTSIEAINQYKSKQKSWDYYSNAEKIYKRFLELFSRLDYINPVKMELKCCLWNFQRICQLLV